MRAAGGFNTTHKLKQLLLLLQQLPGNSPRISLVLGPPASGKTVLAAQLCRKPPCHWRLSRVQGNTDLNSHKLMQQLASDWLPGQRILSAGGFVDELLGLQSQGTLPVLVVDDAEHLPQETLTALFRLLQQADKSPFFPILFADSEQQAEMNKLAGAEALQLLHLSPWTREEVAAFYRQEKGSAPNGRQLEMLMERSGGWPGRLVELIDDPSALNPSRFNLLLGLVLLLLIALNQWNQSSLTPLISGAPRLKSIESDPIDSGSIDLTLGLPELAPRPEPLVSVEDEVAEPVPLKGVDWLLKQSGSGFVLRLGRFSQMSTLQSFAGKHRFDKADPLAGLPMSEGFLLTVGRYKDRRSAIRARLLLPDTIDPDQVSVRRISTLQKQVRRP